MYPSTYAEGVWSTPSKSKSENNSEKNEGEKNAIYKLVKTDEFLSFTPNFSQVHISPDKKRKKIWLRHCMC